MKYRVKRHEVVQPLDQSYRLIPLTQGKNAIVDAADFEWLSQWNWFVFREENGDYYAQRRRPGGALWMHKEILGCSPSEKGDHIDHNTLNNRRANLRKATIAQNTQNQKLQKRQKSSKYKGVYCRNGGNPWCARIGVNGKRIHLGRFRDAETAARAYDKAAIGMHGQFACLNFPE